MVFHHNNSNPETESKCDILSEHDKSQRNGWRVIYTGTNTYYIGLFFFFSVESWGNLEKLRWTYLIADRAASWKYGLHMWAILNSKIRLIFPIRQAAYMGTHLERWRLIVVGWSSTEGNEQGGTLIAQFLIPYSKSGKALQRSQGHLWLSHPECAQSCLILEAWQC